MNNLTEHPLCQDGVVSIAITRYLLSEDVDKERLAHTYFHAIEYRAVNGSWVCLTPEIEHSLQKIKAFTSYGVHVYSSGFEEINFGLGSACQPLSIKDNLFLGGVRIRDSKLQILVCNYDSYGCRHFVRPSDDFIPRNSFEFYNWWFTKDAKPLTIYRIKEIDLKLFSDSSLCYETILYYEYCDWADGFCKTHPRDKMKEREIGCNDADGRLLQNDTFSGGKYLEKLDSDILWGRKVSIDSKHFFSGMVCPVRQEYEVSEQFFNDLVGLVLIEA